MLLITRRESRQLRRYGHLSTGNYNPRTARLYTDIGHLTANPRITADMAQVFQHLASQSRLSGLKSLIVAPFTLHKRMMEHVEAAAAAARAGKPARIVLKMNALTDEALVLALAEAGRAGRDDRPDRARRLHRAGAGAGVLRQRAGALDRSGAFSSTRGCSTFASATTRALYLSSADWMGRNMFRRIELAWPVDDPAHAAAADRRDASLPYLHDERDAWQMMPGGHYERVARAARQGWPLGATGVE